MLARSSTHVSWVHTTPPPLHVSFVFAARPRSGHFCRRPHSPRAPISTAHAHILQAALKLVLTCWEHRSRTRRRGACSRNHRTARAAGIFVIPADCRDFLFFIAIGGELVAGTSILGFCDGFHFEGKFVFCPVGGLGCGYGWAMSLDIWEWSRLALKRRLRRGRLVFPRIFQFRGGDFGFFARNGSCAAAHRFQCVWHACTAMGTPFHSS
ncbi:hypothetical protein PLICRDRAFT_199467 [Plicaturopsis crispa FD-325 SS-3]|nr:hypothetical protein PLICRDRAFT_199467 [Plicaturopsis crispa FD-325 SS-3]